MFISIMDMIYRSGWPLFFHRATVPILISKDVDLNRARAPLLEIVTEPHMGSGVEAGEYASEQLADSSRRERFGEENGGNVYGEFSFCSECCSS
ncbi:unnamed protein product [Brassica oleracea var. botrytis]